jgi:hypothetical protein
VWQTRGAPTASPYTGDDEHIRDLPTTALHPLLWASGVTWQCGRITDAIDIAYGYETSEAWLSSSFRQIDERRSCSRCGMEE